MPETTNEAPKKKDNTTKIILIVVGAVVGLFILGGIVMTLLVGSVFRHATRNIKVNGNGENGSVTIHSDDGNTTATYGTDAALPEGFPSDVPIYDPSTTVYATKTDDTHYSAAAKTSDSVSQVLSYYRSELKNQGWKLTHESSYGEGNILLYKKDKRILSLSVSNQQDEKGENTFINISVQPEPSY